MNRSSLRLVAVLAAFAAFVAAGTAQAAPKPFTAKLSKRGFTLVALASTGKATSARRSGNVRLVPPAARFTLQLVGADGRYAGPVVVGRRGKDVVLGVRAGAKLGTIVVRNGYATLARPVSPRALDRSRTAASRAGVPLGARVFGRVGARAAGAAGSGLDQDRDGVPGAFDVDDDGDLVLDNFERRARFQSAFHALFAEPQPVRGFQLFSNFKLNLAESLNANAGGVTAGQVNAAVARTATLAIAVPPGDTVELDCGGLSYCSKGGTGRAMGGGGSGPLSGPGFPDAFDEDGDGFGTITRGPTGDFQLFTGATAEKIGSGDALIARITTGGVETQLPATLNYIFSTTPALKEWSTGAGAGSIAYPAGPGTAGTPGNPIKVPSVDGKVTMTFWRPQRSAIEGSGEGSGWVDIGRLAYTADVPNAPSSPNPGPTPGPNPGPNPGPTPSATPGPAPSAGPGNCSPAAYSTSDANLSLAGDTLVDATSDRPADPANTLRFTVDLGACLASRGIAWGPGQTLKVDIQARSEYGDNAAQGLYFVRV